MNSKSVCWRCSITHRHVSKSASGHSRSNLSPSLSRPRGRSFCHSSSYRDHVSAQAIPENGDVPPPPPPPLPPPSKRMFYGFQLRRMQGDRTVKGLRAWQEEYKRNEVKIAQEKLSRAERGRSPLTRLVMMSKPLQANVDFDGEDVPSYSVLQGQEEAELQSQRFSDSVAAFEESDDLQPGDLVDFLDKGMPAIYVQRGPVGGRIATAQLYTLKGEVVEVPERRICFRVPNFCNRKEVHSILPYFPGEDGVPSSSNGAESLTHNVPRTISLPLIKKMARFHRQASDLYRRNHYRLDHSLKILERRESYQTVTLAEATKRLFKLPPTNTHPSPESLWAVYQMLSYAHDGAMRTPVDYRKTQLWHIRPSSMHDTISTVLSWWHEYQYWKIGQRSSSTASTVHGSRSARFMKPSKARAAGTDSRVFSDFISMARDRVLRNRQSRSFQEGPAIVGPMQTTAQNASAVPAIRIEEPFRTNDALILRFILSSARDEARSESQTSVVAAMIIRELGLYPSVEDKQFGAFLFLQEMGVLSPWEGREISVASLDLPGYSLTTNIDIMHERMQLSLNRGARSLKDQMAGRRKVWANQKVYCVDSDSTTTIDDGFSIERVQGNESEVWLHIHVANPTAFIHQQHPIAEYARQIGSTVYLPNTVYSSSDAKFISDVASLEKDRPCLTFSAKLDRQGNLLDHQISSGILQDVHFLTPETLQEVVGIGVNRSGPTLATVRVGQFPDDTEQQQRQRQLLRSNELTSDQIADLKLWGEFAAAWHNKRLSPSTSAVRQAFNRMSCSVRVSGGLPILPDVNTARTIAGDPGIELQLKAPPPPPSVSSVQVDLVEEAMLVAGNVAAIWCARHGIPAPYRISTTKEGLPSRDKYFTEVIQPLIAAGKPVPASLATEMAKLNRSEYSIAPKEHEDLGLSAYLRVTSPLRRWPDMLSHFQIEAVLKQKSEEKTSAANPDSCLPFTAERVASEIADHELLQTRHFLLAKEAQREWIIRALARAFYWKESVLPNPISVTRLPGTKSVLSHVELKPIFIASGFNVLCELDETLGPAQQAKGDGDFEAEITGVSVERQRLFIRLLQPNEDA